MAELEDWIGRSESVVDTLDPARSNALDIALGGEGTARTGDPMPLLHHWIYFWDVKPHSALGADGHPAKGGFLPPVSLPRRMWAGGRLTFHQPLRLGGQATRTSTILAIRQKTGRSGSLVFVTVLHELDGGDGLAVSEEQDLVYREPADGALPAPVACDPEPSAWHHAIDPDPVLLFRYSALTMNGHRIHYDRTYAIEQEGYPALVVHGPLQATLMLNLAARNLPDPITSFAYRGQQPVFDGTRLHVCGEPEAAGAQMWTQQGNARNMVATVRTGAAA